MSNQIEYASADVLQAIPHRPPFLFVDVIVETGDNFVITQRTIRAEEAYFEGHYPGNPIMPGVLLCESVFQTGAIFLMNKLRASGEDLSSRTPVLSRIGEAKFKRMVKPGDIITIEAKLKETMGQFYFMTGTVRKDDKVALSIEFALALVAEE